MNLTWDIFADSGTYFTIVFNARWIDFFPQSFIKIVKSHSCWNKISLHEIKTHFSCFNKLGDKNDEQTRKEGINEQAIKRTKTCHSSHLILNRLNCHGRFSISFLLNKKMIGDIKKIASWIPSSLYQLFMALAAERLKF